MTIQRDNEIKMTTFKIVQIYTPDEAREDRKTRTALCNSDHSKWVDVLHDGLTALGWDVNALPLSESDASEQIGDKDDPCQVVSDDNNFIDFQEYGEASNDGKYDWRIILWNSKPTTKDEIWDWARANSTKPFVVLRELLGRRLWERLDLEEGAFELRQELHNLYYGVTAISKTIAGMSKDELLTEVMEQIVTPTEKRYDPNRVEEPCSFEWVRKQQHRLWTNESTLVK